SGIPSLIVTTNADPNPSDGVSSGANCTLREAIQRANALAGANTITFAPGVIGTITLSTLGELSITNDNTITAPAARLLAISGGSSLLILIITGSSITISGLTLSDVVFGIFVCIG